ncbi:MAG: hypothetical protein N4A68_16070 [Maledivibacter sp.]|nr:hypothetical protein [Maledivibacter sp.]
MANGIKSILENIKLFFIGALDMQGKAHGHIENEASEAMDQFMLLCFGDILGVDLPTTYYALELLPYLAEELEKWQMRMTDKKSIWEEKAGKLDIDP